VREDRGDKLEFPYINAVPLPDRFDKHDGLLGSIRESLIDNNIPCILGKLYKP
jgi:hypothetical protein